MRLLSVVILAALSATACSTPSQPTSTLISPAQPAPTASQTNISTTMNDKDIALFAAAPPGDAETVRQLLAQGASVKYQNAGGARHTEVVRLLVQAGAIVNLADSNGVTPLAHAKQRGDKDIAAILERAGAG